jgi:hypothetical protein
VGGGDRRQPLLGAGGERAELAAHGVELVQRHAGQLRVVVEPAGQRLGQGAVLGLELAAGQAGTAGSRSPAVSAASLSRTDRPSGLLATLDPLVSASSSSLLQPLRVPGARMGQVGPQPGVVAPPPDLCGGHEAGPQHAPLGQLGQPDRTQPVGVGPARAGA